MAGAVAVVVVLVLVLPALFLVAGAVVCAALGASLTSAGDGTGGQMLQRD